MSNHARIRSRPEGGFALYGWIGLVMVAAFWMLNWSLDGVRTHWVFFPLWLGYCLTIDALVLLRKGTSLLKRSWRKYIGLFLLSAPTWWVFETFNWHLQNWYYEGSQLLNSFEFSLWETLGFSTVIPAVFGSAELIGTFTFVRSIKRGPIIRPDKLTTIIFFTSGWILFTMMILWPQYFFPFLWLSLYFILEPINVWLGNHHLAYWTNKGDWRPVIGLWLGVLLTGFFWEMWNYFSYPKWIYTIPWGQFLPIFEMPLLGYAGYLPFALELYAIYHFVTGMLGEKKMEYVQLMR